MERDGVSNGGEGKGGASRGYGWDHEHYWRRGKETNMLWMRGGIGKGGIGI